MITSLSSADILGAYRSANGNVDRAAASVGLKKSAFYTRLKKIRNSGGFSGISPALPISGAGNIPAEKPELSEFIPGAPVPNFQPRAWYGLLDQFYQSKSPIFLIGEAGSGKTAAFFQFAFERQIPILQVSCDFGLNLKDLLGFKSIRGSAGAPEIFFQPGRLVPFLQSRSIILFDELNLLSADNQAPLYRLLANRIISSTAGEIEIPVSPECWIVFTGNTISGRYSAVKPLNSAIANRMAATIHVKPFTLEEISTLIGNQLDSAIKDSLLKFYDSYQINRDSYKTVISIRNIFSFISLYHYIKDLSSAVYLSLLNPARLTSNDREFESLESNAMSFFPDFVHEI